MLGLLIWSLMGRVLPTIDCASVCPEEVTWGKISYYSCPYNVATVYKELTDCVFDTESGNIYCIYETSTIECEEPSEWAGDLGEGWL